MSGITNAFFGININGIVQLQNASIDDITTLPTNASASYSLTALGVANETTVSGGTVQIGNNWLTGSTNGSAYEVFATLTSGTLSTGTTGSWLSLGTNRTWSRASTGSLQSATLTIQIRDVATQTVQATATVTLSATANP